MVESKILSKELKNKKKKKLKKSLKKYIYIKSFRNLACMLFVCWNFQNSVSLFISMMKLWSGGHESSGIVITQGKEGKTKTRNY